jgi:hypothetical protein
MKRLFSAKPLVAAAVALGAFAAASAAHARSEVFFSIGIQAPGVYVQSAPVYVQPQPVYVPPRPVYVQPHPVYVQPQPIYVQPRHVQVQPRHVQVQPRPIYGPPPYHGPGWERRGKWQHLHGPWGDLDRDGIVNRNDRFPHDPYRW